MEGLVSSQSASGHRGGGVGRQIRRAGGRGQGQASEALSREAECEILL